MKTATVTWITYNNYGTLLQAYALQQQLLKMDIDNRIICDREILNVYREKNPLNHQDSSPVGKDNRFTRLKKLVRNPNRIAKVIQARINRPSYEKPYEDSQKLCEMFRRSDLNIYYDVQVDKLSKLNDEFDIFIAGSDQIWSVFQKNFNPYYYLDFVSKKKVAYAPSLGTSTISSSLQEKIKDLLLDYSHISVREQQSAVQLTKLLNRKVEWVLDPTLLHDMRFWANIAVPVPHRKSRYLLCYFLENKEWYFSYAKNLANKLQLKIVLIPSQWNFVSNENVTKTGVGPKEFVSLIQNSEYVLTDSYHGSIFALIFQRNFQYLLRFRNEDPNSQNIRIQSLFNLLGLNGRIVYPGMKVHPPIEIQNYESISNQIEKMRIISQKYLQECVRKQDD